MKSGDHETKQKHLEQILYKLVWGARYQDSGHGQEILSCISTPKLHVSTQLGSTDSHGRVVYVHSEIQSVPYPAEVCSHVTCFFAEGQLNIYPESHPQ